MLMIKGLVDNQKAIGFLFCSNDFLMDAVCFDHVSL